MSPDRYDEWAKRWATGMRASEPYRDARRVAQQPRAVQARAEGAKRPCGIQGCERHSYKGRLCRKHYAMVPYMQKMTLMIEAAEASAKVAARHHRRFLRELQASLDESGPEGVTSGP